MSNVQATTSDIASSHVQAEVPVGEKRRRWFEVCLVLLAACGSSFLNAIFILRNGVNAVPHNSNERWLIGILQEVISLLLLGYVLSRRSLRFKDLGLRWRLGDLGMGLLVAAISYASYVLGSMLVHYVHYAMYGVLAKSLSGRDFFAHPPAAAIPFALLNPFFEELIVRAYLMTEVSELTGSSILAIAVSVAVQFSYHLYYGWTGAISLSFQFLIFAVYYARSRRILPVIVAHALFDIYGIVHLW
jgi:membrane protease YdiL (CAAX protease family)